MIYCNVQLKKVPEDDPRLAATKDIIARVQKKNNWIRGAQTESAKEADQEQEHGEDVHHEHIMQDDVAADDQHMESVTTDSDTEEPRKEPVTA